VNIYLLLSDLKEDFEPFAGQTVIYDGGMPREVEAP
jgi:hypothetical protein